MTSHTQTMSVGLADLRIRATNIEKSFGSLEVLKGVSLSARAGDVVTLIGSSGSGKSTFLRCLNLLDIPDAGDIEIDGEMIHIDRTSSVSSGRHSQLLRIRQSLGMVFQSFNLWNNMTVLENVAAVPIHVLKRNRQDALLRAESLLEMVGIADKRSQYPSQLSGGQQQRAAIARALAIEPKALLFDEPTSALDPELVSEVLKVIRRLAEAGTTMILVTHEMRFAAEISNNVLFLHKGRVEEEGPPKQVFRNPQTERCREFLSSIL